MKPRQLNKEDLKFLLDLQYEMNTQDHVGQASPRFWVVREDWKEWGIDSDYADDCCICDEDGNEYYSDTLEGTLKLLEESYEIGQYEVFYNGGIGINEPDYSYDVFSLEDIVNYIDEKFNEELRVCYFKKTHRVVPNTMFLTLKECENHIESNHYHYKNGRPYAMTAWRSPQVQKLYEILENVVWEDSVNEEVINNGQGIY